MDTDQVTARPGWVVAGPLALQDDGGAVRFHGADLPLTNAQCLILLALVSRGGRIAHRSEIYVEAFGRKLTDGSRAVDTHVARIRRVLGPAGRCIVTVGRVGYRLDLDRLANGNAVQR